MKKIALLTTLLLCFLVAGTPATHAKGKSTASKSRLDCELGGYVDNEYFFLKIKGNGGYLYVSGDEDNPRSGERFPIKVTSRTASKMRIEAYYRGRPMYIFMGSYRMLNKTWIENFHGSLWFYEGYEESFDLDYYGGC